MIGAVMAATMSNSKMMLPTTASRWREKRRQKRERKKPPRVVGSTAGWDELRLVARFVMVPFGLATGE